MITSSALLPQPTDSPRSGRRASTGDAIKPRQGGQQDRRPSMQPPTTADLPPPVVELLEEPPRPGGDGSHRHHSDHSRPPGGPPPPQAHRHSDIQICINDVSVADMGGDYMKGGGAMKTLSVPQASRAEGRQDGKDVDFDQDMDQVKRQWRRSSWCPEDGRKKEEKHEKQKMILAVVGKSQSLSSLEGDDDDTEDDESKPAPLHGGPWNQHQGSGTRSSKGHGDSKQSTHASGSKADKLAEEAAKQARRTRRGSQVCASILDKSSQAALINKVMYAQYSQPGRGGPLVGNIIGQSAIPESSSGFHPSCLPPTSNDCACRRDSTASVDSTTTDIGCDSLPSWVGQEFGDESSDSLSNFGDKILCDRARARILAAEAASNMSTGEEDDDDLRKDSKQKVKRRGSVFSKLGSYRQKKLVGRDANKTGRGTHQFVLISFSNSTTCDVCGKSMANKPALQCENCGLNVHANTCKDQTFACTRLTQACNGESCKGNMMCVPGTQSVVHMKSVPAVTKEKDKRALSVPSRAPQNTNQNQVLQNQRNASQSSSVSRQTTVNTGYFQWRRVATKLGIDRVISEDRGKDSGSSATEDSPSISSRVMEGPGLFEPLSASVESLEDPMDLGGADLGDDDPDLILSEHEPEAWSVTVDKRTLKKMTAKNIKRQDHIWEFIQTEKSHYRTLMIMQKIFAYGMHHELSMTREMIDRIFPKLEDLIDIHLTFLRSLISAQKMSNDKSIDEIGRVLIQQFEGKTAQQMKVAYGYFCSKHNGAMQLYKDLLKSDIAFQAFIKAHFRGLLIKGKHALKLIIGRVKSSRNFLCKRLGIPECILLVTQRTTKYPLLIEPIIKTTADNSQDKALLSQCLTAARDILSHIDREVDAHEKEQRLFDIYNKIDARSSAMLNGKKFKKSDVLSNKRKLLFEGHIKWMSARGKPFEVLSVLLSDVLFFLTENSQKSNFYSQDNKSSVVPLTKLLVREKGDTRDSKGLYLIVQSKTEPEMYEFVCKSADDRKIWINTIREAIANCPEEGEPSGFEEERKLQEAIGSRLRQLIDHLHQKDHAIHLLCEDKMSIALEIMEIFSKDDVSQCLQSADNACFKINNPADLFPILLNEVNRLFALMQPSNKATSIVKSFNSTCDHGIRSSVTNSDEFEDSGTAYLALHIPKRPKRAETFQYDGRRRRVSEANIHQIATIRFLQERFALRNGEGPKSGIQSEILHEHDGPEKTDSVDQEDVDESRTSHEEPQDDKDKDKDMDKDSEEPSLPLSIQPVTHDDDDDDDDDGDDNDDDEGCITPQESENSKFDLTLTKEQCICITKILQCVHKIICLTSRQTTENESVKAYLAETNCRNVRLQTENDKMSHERKSTSYHPDKQLEELRSLQSSIQQQKADLDKEKDEQIASNNAKCDQLHRLQEEIEKQRADIKAEKDEIRRQREALQFQMDFFEEQKQRTLRAQASMSQVSGMTDVTRGRSGTISNTGPRRDVVHRPLLDSLTHQRSSSEDLLQRWTAGEVPGTYRRSTTPERSGQVQNPRDRGGYGGAEIGRSGDGRPISRIHSMSAVVDRGPGRLAIIRRADGTQVPIQLMPEQKTGSIPQQLPLKISCSSSGCSSLRSVGPGSNTEIPLNAQHPSGVHDPRLLHRLGGRSPIDFLTEPRSSSSLPTSPQNISPATSPQSAPPVSHQGNKFEAMSDRRFSPSGQASTLSPKNPMLAASPKSPVAASGSPSLSPSSPVGPNQYHHPSNARNSPDISPSSELHSNRVSSLLSSPSSLSSSSSSSSWSSTSTASHKLSNKSEPSYKPPPPVHENKSTIPQLFSTMSSGNLFKLAERHRPKSIPNSTNQILENPSHPSSEHSKQNKGQGHSSGNSKDSGNFSGQDLKDIGYR